MLSLKTTTSAGFAFLVLRERTEVHQMGNYGKSSGPKVALSEVRA